MSGFVDGRFLRNLQVEYWRSSLLAKAFIALGFLYSAQATSNILTFASLYLPRRSFNKYIESSSDGTWSLITGASDGIGRAFAEELCSRGVNVILHGRNESKLHGVRDDLLRQWPARQIRILDLDASTEAADADKLNDVAKSLSDIDLRILVNNVGGTGTVSSLWAPLSQRSSSDVGQIIDITARFPTEITRVLLPLLTKHQPSLILNIGSGISDFASPYIEVYAGAKAYNQSFSRSLGLEMVAEGHNVEVIHLQVGMVATDGTKRPSSALVPSARHLANCGLNAAGCGREVIWPYWPHAVQFGIITWLPQWLRNRLVLGIVMKEKALNVSDASDKAGR